MTGLLDVIERYAKGDVTHLKNLTNEEHLRMEMGTLVVKLAITALEPMPPSTTIAFTNIVTL